MAIPVYLQQFKAAGIYRVVFDKSTVLNQDTQILRLVVGYSERGPFNIPVYVKDPQTFKALYGDRSKKLEKRGIYFHKLALQMLQTTPILCLNLKKFDGETVDGATIDTSFNPKFDPIDDVVLNVKDIYDTTRFWELNADKLNDLRGATGEKMDQYLNICTTDTKATSATYFIRKASGNKVSQYNLTLNDWYSDRLEEIPEYLEDYKNNLVSDYFAEVYVFKGKFTSKQVLSSSTLKNYFIVTDKLDKDGEPVLQLRDKVIDAFGEPQDTLDALYQDETSNAIGHYIGSLIPYFKNKQGSYVSLDIVFNSDQEIHKMMMSFNVDMLEEEGTASIDISGRLAIPTIDAIEKKKIRNNGFTLETIYAGTAKTNVLGNLNSPVIADVIKFGSNVYDRFTDPKKPVAVRELSKGRVKIGGTMYVKSIEGDTITVHQVGMGTDGDIKIKFNSKDEALNSAAVLGVPVKSYIDSKCKKEYLEEVDGAETVKHDLLTDADLTSDVELAALDGNGLARVHELAISKEDTLNGHYIGTFFDKDNAFTNKKDPLNGPAKVITSLSRITKVDETTYTDEDSDIKPSFLSVNPVTKSKFVNKNIKGDSVYGSSVSFIDYIDDNWEYKLVDIKGYTQYALVNSKAQYDDSLLRILQEGECILAQDGTNDLNEDGEINRKDLDNYYDNVYITELGTKYYDADDKEVVAGVHKVGDFQFHYIVMSEQPLMLNQVNTKHNDNDQSWTGWGIDSDTDDSGSGSGSTKNKNTNSVLVRIDNPLNQEIGVMQPRYLEGYTFKNARPNGTGMYAKIQWQNTIMSALTDYKGLRTGLLNKSEIDYRYVIDTFQSFPTSSLKSTFSYLCKEKQSAFCISNFPAVRDFVKCPYTSFTNVDGIFDVDYVVKGYNKKKAASMRFSLPSDSEGASFIAFYTPLKFSDGYVEDIVPSAGLVSNLFIEKYMSRQPYFIVAGPNYGNISAPGLIGPDYKYSNDELQLIEPFGVNCMVYRPNFGTFINANQTAKQTPVSALSKVNVRELVIYIQDEIEKVLQAYQWEFNNQITRNAILDKANQICAVTAANGGIQAYRNTMDESNNTPEIIDNEMAIISTEIEPGMGCSKMVQELTLYRTGHLSSKIRD